MKDDENTEKETNKQDVKKETTGFSACLDVCGKKQQMQVPRFLTTLLVLGQCNLQVGGGRGRGKAMSSVLGLESEMFMEYTYSRQ